MNKKLVTWFVGGLLLLILVLWLVDSPENIAGKSRSYTSDWDTEYGIYSKNPKDLGFFNDLLTSHISDSAGVADNYFALDTLKDLKKATLLYIGDGLDLKRTELEKLLIRVDSGATLFLSYNRSDMNSYEAFFTSNAYYWEYTNKTYVAMGDTSLGFSPMNQNDTIFDDWYTFDPKALRDTLSKPFMYSMYNPVAVEMKRGKGRVILHSMPQLFVNYQVIQPNGFAHASYCLKKINRKEPVVWLEFARYYKPDPDEDTEGPQVERDSSYLQFIMANQSLRWAFLLALFTFILYVLFRAKRRQAVLPGIPEKRNMSLAFVDTLTSIYLSRNSPYSLLLLMRKNFYITVSRHFYIDLIIAKTPEQKAQQELNTKKLAGKAKGDKEDLEFILNHLSKDALKSHTVNSYTIAQLHKTIRKFYHANGIMKEPLHFVKEKEEVILHRSILVGGIVTLASLLIIMRGMYLLAAGNGLGIFLVILAAAGIVFGLRFMSVPVAKITRSTLTVYKPFLGKTTIELEVGEFTFTRQKDKTEFYTQDGRQLAVNHNSLSKSGKRALKLFTEHLKQKES